MYVFVYTHICTYTHIHLQMNTINTRANKHTHANTHTHTISVKHIHTPTHTHTHTQNNSINKIWQHTHSHTQCLCGCACFGVVLSDYVNEAVPLFRKKRRICTFVCVFVCAFVSVCVFASSTPYDDLVQKTYLCHRCFHSTVSTKLLESLRTSLKLIQECRMIGLCEWAVRCSRPPITWKYQACSYPVQIIWQSKSRQP